MCSEGYEWCDIEEEHKHYSGDGCVIVKNEL